MLCSYGFPSAMNLSQDYYWSGLWPEVRPLLHQRDLLLQELHPSLQLMDTLQNKLLEETEAPQPMSQQPHTEGQPFVLRLNAQGFSPEELSVGQEGRTLRVQGRTEKKQEENGRSSYTVQEWTQELCLPEGLHPEELHCYLSPDGTLHIQDTPNTCDTEAQRELPIRRLEEDRLIRERGETEGQETQDSNETEDTH